MNKTAILWLMRLHGKPQFGVSAAWPAKRETFQRAVKPAGVISCCAGRKRPCRLAASLLPGALPARGRDLVLRGQEAPLEGGMRPVGAHGDARIGAEGGEGEGFRA